MRTITIRKTSAAGEAYSVRKPATSEALELRTDLAEPPPPGPGQFLVQVHAASVTRDELTWPETYGKHGDWLMGHDFAGTVAAVGEGGEGVEDTGLAVGDRVFGMTHADRPGAWAEYALVERGELARMPAALNFAHAATVPMSALTAWQALFEQAGIDEPDLGAARQPSSDRKVFITGGTGAVGIYLVQLARLAGLHVVAGSTNKAVNDVFLRSLCASDVVQYDELAHTSGEYDYIIDTVGGDTLKQTDRWIKSGGTVVTIDSGSFDFGDKQPPATKHYNTKFFIVRPDARHLDQIARAFETETGRLQSFLAATLPLEQARDAYELASGRTARRGKIVLSI